MTEPVHVINIAKDFSTYPAGREPKDGPNNATRFRQELLLPALRDAMRAGGDVVVSLDGVLAPSANFLAEAFGGLVSKEGLEPADVKRHLKVRGPMPGSGRYIDAIARYIDGTTP